MFLMFQDVLKKSGGEEYAIHDVEYVPRSLYSEYMSKNDFEGGLFWDGRATGLRLGIPAAEQALGPFMNPVEQNHPSEEAVLNKIKSDPVYEYVESSLGK